MAFALFGWSQTAQPLFGIYTRYICIFGSLGAMIFGALLANESLAMRKNLLACMLPNPPRSRRLFSGCAGERRGKPRYNLNFDWLFSLFKNGREPVKQQHHITLKHIQLTAGILNE